MAICEVGTGKTYGTLALAEAANFGGPATLTEPVYVHCFPVTNGDSAACTILGMTTSATNYITVMMAPEHEGDGVFDESLYYMVNALSTCLTVSQGYTRVIGLQFDVRSTSANYVYGWSATTWGCTLERSIIRGTYGTNANRQGARSAYAGTSVKIVGNIIYDFVGAANYGIIATGNDNLIYHNTVVNCTTGIRSGGTTGPTAINNLTQGCSDGYSGNFASGSDYNVSDLASDAPGANSVQLSVTFADSPSKDFHLTSPLQPAYDLSASVAVDIDGQAITSRSIGADAQAGAADGGGISASASITLDDATMSASGLVEIQGAASISLDDATVAASGSVVSPITASAAIALEDATVSASGAVTSPATGTAVIVLDDAGVSGFGGAEVPAVHGSGVEFFPVAHPLHFSPKALPVVLTADALPVSFAPVSRPLNYVPAARPVVLEA